MKVAWVDILCDPVNKEKLKLVNPVIKKGHIKSGKLLGQSGNIYNIKDGIPILLPKGTQSRDSVKSFAFEWNKWGYTFAKTNWLKNNIIPFLGSQTAFRNKTIIDAGAGSGAQSLWMAEAGAKFVISMELSDTIFNRHKETIKGFEDIIFPIQCDIAYPPVNIKPDILYCVNVLQHTKNPKKTFENIVSLIKENTLFLFNVYNKEGFLGSKTVEILRKVINIFPFKIWRFISFFVTLGIFSVNKITPWAISAIYSDVHFSSDFKELWLQIYDAFGSHYYQFPLSQREQLELFKRAKLKIKIKKEFGYLLVKKNGK